MKNVVGGVWRFGVAVAAVVTAISACSSPLDRKIDFDITGRVLDADTREPIEGAYVIAIYKIQRAGFAAVASFCVKTLGMYTGKDGAYHFPVEKLDGRNPYITQAIKSGYFWKDSRFPDTDEARRQDITTYSNRDIFLKKQDPDKPDWHLGNGEEVCNDARTVEGAAPGIKYLEIELAETVKYGGSRQGKEALESQIAHLRRLPSDSQRR